MSRYALGIDVGARTVTAAVCGVEDGIPDGGARALDRDGTGYEQLLRDLPVQRALTRVGDPTPLYGGPEPRSGATVLADAIARVVRGAESAEGAAPVRTVVAVPPSWGEHRREQLSTALAALTGTECTLASSAVAATRHHRATAGAVGAGTVAVYDLGAGTVDTAVVRASADGTLAHAAVPPAPCPWGGRDVDDAVLDHVRAAAGLPEPPSTPAGRASLTALRTACVTAKEQLSTMPAVRVPVDGPGSVASVRLVRSDLDELIAASIAESVTVVRAAVADAGLRPEDLDGLVLAGGGVLVPLVAETLSAELDVPLLVDERPALTVACGAAELAADLVISAEAVAELPDDDQAEDDLEDAVVVDLGARRLVAATQRGILRAGIVAALLAVLFATPMSLMGVLGSGVHSRSTQDVAEAEEVPVPVPPGAPTDSPAPAPAPAAGADSRSQADVPAPAPRRSDTAAGPTTEPAPAPAPPPVAPAAPPPVDAAPPVDAVPPTDSAPPADQPPADQPPVDEPPVDEPPADPGPTTPDPTGPTTPDPVPTTTPPSPTPSEAPAGTGSGA